MCQTRIIRIFNKKHRPIDDHPKIFTSEEAIRVLNQFNHQDQS